jgi:hypothetical protein
LKKNAIIIGLALAVVAASGASAAAHYLITSTHQIKPSVLRQLHGRQGARGPRGPQGPAGQSGLASHVSNVQSEMLTLQPGQTSFDVDPNNFEATCPAGQTVVGTGFNGPFPVTGGFVEAFGTFVGGFFANESSIPVTAQVEAICAAVPDASAASARAAGVDRYHAMLKHAESTQ